MSPSTSTGLAMPTLPRVGDSITVWVDLVGEAVTALVVGVQLELGVQPECFTVRLDEPYAAIDPGPYVPADVGLYWWPDIGADARGALAAAQALAGPAFPSPGRNTLYSLKKTVYGTNTLAATKLGSVAWPTKIRGAMVSFMADDANAFDESVTIRFMRANIVVMEVPVNIRSTYTWQADPMNLIAVGDVPVDVFAVRQPQTCALHTRVDLTLSRRF